MHNMNEIKFTTDGRKVVVIGDLNQTEKIVQEIFVTKDGAEIPSGERFVVKSLLDSPAKSWKEIDLKKSEERYLKEKEEWDKKISRINEEKSLAYSSLQSRVKWLKSIAREPQDDNFKKAITVLQSFFSNIEKWVFVEHYGDWELDLFNEDGHNRLLDKTEDDYRRKRFDSMRLLSLFGDTDGNVSYKINEYSDGSGYDKEVEFFNSKEAALCYMQNRLDSINSYSSHDLKNATNFGLKLDEHKLYLYNEKCKKVLQDEICKIKKQLEEAESKMSQYKNG